MATNYPEIISVTYDSTRKTVLVLWTPDIPDKIGWTLNLNVEGEQSTHVDLVMGTSQNEIAALALNNNLASVQITGNGYSSDSKYVIVLPPKITVNYIDPTSIEVSWDIIQGGIHCDSQIYLFSDNDKRPIWFGSFKGDKGVITPKSILTPSENYYIEGKSKFDCSTGPTSKKIVLIQESSEIKCINYNDKTSELLVQTISPPPSTLFSWISLYSKGKVIQQGVSENGIFKLDFPLKSLESYTVGVQYCNSNPSPDSFGTISDLEDVVTVIPSLFKTEYCNERLKVWWLEFSAFPNNYNITLLEDGKLFVTQPHWTVTENSALALLTSPLDPAKNYTITLSVQSGVSVGPASNPIDVITSTKEITNVKYNGNIVTANWSTGYNTGITGYNLVLFNGLTKVRTVPGGDTSGFINAVINSDMGEYSIALQQISGYSFGPYSNKVPILTTRPGKVAFTTSPVTGEINASWNPVTEITEYILFLEPENTLLSSKTTSCTLPVPFNPNSEISFIFGYCLEKNGYKTTIVQSKSTTIPTGQPKLLNVDYDGVTISSLWEDVSNATGYTTSLIATKGKITGVLSNINSTVLENSSIITFDKTADGTEYEIVVQATFDNGVSGPASNSLPIFKPGFFISTLASQKSFPYIYPATEISAVSTPPPGETLPLYFPEIGDSKLVNLPISVPEKNPLFVFQATGSLVYPYQLFIDKKSPIWTFDKSAIRLDLIQGVKELIIALEEANAMPWGINMVQDALSRYLPQTFKETLFLAYGMDGTSSAVDLRPGMILRIGVNTIQTAGFSGNQQWLNGYSGGPVLEYEIGSKIDSTGKWSVGFDNFIGELISDNLLNVNPPDEGTRWNQQSGIADAAGLYYSNFPSSYHRLLPPQTISNTTESCSSDTTKQFVIAASEKYSEILDAKNITGGICPIAYFRGRSIIRVAIRVSINNHEHVVPVGTTLLNLLETTGCVPSLANMNIDGLIIKRNLGSVVIDKALPLSTSNSYNIRVDWKTLASFSPGWTSLSIPLLPGDVITTH